MQSYSHETGMFFFSQNIHRKRLWCRYKLDPVFIHYIAPWPGTSAEVISLRSTSNSDVLFFYLTAILAISFLVWLL